MVAKKWMKYSLAKNGKSNDFIEDFGHLVVLFRISCYICDKN